MLFLALPGAAQPPKLSGADVAKLEKGLETNPDDVGARTKLLEIYKNAIMEVDRKSKVRNLIWFAKHQPDSDIFLNPAARLKPDDLPVALQAERNELIAAWREQMKAHPDDEAVYENALRSLNQIDYDASVESLKGLRRIEPTNPRWAFLLATLYEGALTNKELASKAQLDLNQSNDLAVVGLTGQDLYVMGKTGKAEPLQQFGEFLLNRARELDPLGTRWLASNSTKSAILQEKDLWPYGKIPPMEIPAGTTRVAPAVQAAKAIKHQQPVCTPVPSIPCPETRTAVKMDVIIGKDGRVKRMHALNGQINTIPQAMDAVRQWTYKPTLVNGQPVEVATQVDAVFTPTKTAAATKSTPAPKAVGPAVKPASPIVAPEPTTKVEAAFTPEARAAGFNGYVVVSLTVDENGMPKDAKVSQGAGYGLNEKALEAVKQWRFKPATQDGKPIAVPANVRVYFKSSR